MGGEGLNCSGYAPNVRSATAAAPGGGGAVRRRFHLHAVQERLARLAWGSPAFTVNPEASPCRRNAPWPGGRRRK